MTRHGRASRGFTLIELMVATVAIKFAGGAVESVAAVTLGPVTPYSWR